MRIVRQLLTESILLGLVGGGLGVLLLGAFAVTQALRKALYQVRATDPLTFASVAGLLLAIAVIASWAPALRATRVELIVSLRAE